MRQPFNWGGRRRALRSMPFVIAVLVAAALIVPVTLAATVANLATLADPVHVNHDDIKFQTKGATDFQIATLSFAPGTNSGWHHHPGIIWVLVEQGSVTIHDANCQTRTVPAGQVFLEAGDTPMMVSNDGTTTAVVYNTQVVPHGAPSKIADAPPACAVS